MAKNLNLKLDDWKKSYQLLGFMRCKGMRKKDKICLKKQPSF